MPTQANPQLATVDLLKRRSDQLKAVEEYISEWRQRLNKTGPDYTIDGSGYIPESVIEELESILSSKT